MKKLFLLIALAMLTFSAGHSQTAFDMKHIPAPLFRCPIYDGAADPAIQWNPEHNEWWIFYTQRRANVPNLPGVAYCYGTKIGIAASSDNGRSWYYIGHANLPEPDQGENTFWAPDVFVDGDTYYMIVTHHWSAPELGRKDKNALLQKQGPDKLGTGGRDKEH